MKKTCNYFSHLVILHAASSRKMKRLGLPVLEEFFSPNPNK